MWKDIVEMPPSFFSVEPNTSMRGFSGFLRAMYFLWVYPRNRVIFSLAFGISTRQVEGENLWGWVRIISDLKAIKIIWPMIEYEDPDKQIFIATGTRFNRSVRRSSSVHITKLTPPFWGGKIPVLLFTNVLPVSIPLSMEDMRHYVGSPTSDS